MLLAVCKMSGVLTFSAPSSSVHGCRCRQHEIFQPLYMSDLTDEKTESRSFDAFTDAAAQALKKSNQIAPVEEMDVLASFTVGVKEDEYKRRLLTIGFITLIFSSNSPALHAAFSGADPPPVLLLNAAVSFIALVGLVLGGESLESGTPLPSALKQNKEDEDSVALKGGCELGLWKFLGTTANLYGLALTTAGHGALLIQLTTLIVPVVQGIQGVPIPRRIQFSIALAVAGVVCFTQDTTGSPSALGDALCVLAAVF